MYFRDLVDNWWDLIQFVLMFAGGLFFLCMLLCVFFWWESKRHYDKVIKKHIAQKKAEEDARIARLRRKEQEARDHHTIDTAKEFE